MFHNIADHCMWSNAAVVSIKDFFQKPKYYQPILLSQDMADYKRKGEKSGGASSAKSKPKVEDDDDEDEDDEEEEEDDDDDDDD